jgi:hypothetical protein
MGIAQTKNYTDRQVCTSYELHKGKSNHGKPYCVAWGTVRRFKNGKEDTVSWSMNASTAYFGDKEGYEKHKSLSQRNRYIVDSLNEDGISELSSSYLSYEPIYMDIGSKTESFYSIQGNDIMVLKYLFWKSKTGQGIRLVKEYKVK